MTGKKNRLIGIWILGFFLLSAGIFASVEIKTENGEPLINLDELLAGSELGRPGSEDEGSLISPTEEEEDSSGVTGQETQQPEKPMQIVIWNKSVLYQGNYYTYDRDAGEIEDFEEVLRDIGDRQVILQDNYAEAHAYRYVLEKIRAVTQDDSRIVQTTGGREEGSDEK